jgi:hypothetical protein
MNANASGSVCLSREVYSSDNKLRRFCEQRGLHYAVAISSQACLFLNGQRKRGDEHTGQLKPQA